MNEATIVAYITAIDGVETVTVDDNIFFFTGPDHMFPFATFITHDDEYETFSDLNRPGIFRLNVGVSKATFPSLFGATAPRPAAAATADASAYDFAALDRLLLHPTYGRQFWVCILNPTPATFDTTIKPLLAEAYDIACGRDEKRAARS